MARHRRPRGDRDDPLAPTVDVLELHAVTDVPEVKFENCGPGNLGGPSTAYHDIDDALDSTFAIIGFGSAGFRIFDVRDPANPREVAYFNHGASAHTKPYIIKRTGHMWVSGAGGFRVLELEPHVRTYLGLDGPNVPPSLQACKVGGWKTYTDDQNQPFQNQGDCVSYVDNQAGG